MSGEGVADASDAGEAPASNLSTSAFATTFYKAFATTSAFIIDKQAGEALASDLDKEDVYPPQGHRLQHAHVKTTHGGIPLDYLHLCMCIPRVL